ncbi:MAG: hypothetical protein J6Y17_03940 [Elusimicrobiaceae bacterium]|nr:hypothetical protein [Elusimicrobiaceae bacterium]
MKENKNTLWVLLGLLGVLLITIFLLGALLVSIMKTQPVHKEAEPSGAPKKQIQSVAKSQTFEKKPDSSSHKAFTPPFDEEIAARIKKLFEPILSDTESEKMGQSYAAKGYHVRIMPDLYEDLHVQHLSAEEQTKYQQILSAHQQALKMLQQDRSLATTQTATPAMSASNKFYLPGLSSIKGLKGQAQIGRREIACPNRGTEYKNWDKICQEIQFADGTKSIIYVVTARGITARDDFDRQGHLLAHYGFWTSGGYFDSEKIRHIPDYPSAVSEAFFYDKANNVNKIEIYLSGAAAERTKQSLQQAFAGKQMPDIVTQSFKDAPEYCDLYKSECVAL